MKVKEVLNTVLTKFESGDIPAAVALICFPVIDMPMNKWSLLNRLIVFFSGSQDVRGIRQWEKIGRSPIKGSKAIHILAPMLKKKEDENGEKQVISGFMLVPVFRFEDTEGEVVEYPELNVPEFPFMERAKQWGISVNAISGNSYCYGAYSQTQKEIVLASPEESVFFHELCHSAHHRINGSLKAGQDWKQEIVAELGAIVLCKLVGKEPDKALGNGYSYISRYAEGAGLPPLTAMVKVLADTEKVLTLIMKGGDICHLDKLAFSGKQSPTKENLTIPVN